MTAIDLAHHRLQNQHIAAPALSPCEVVAHLVAIQAQDFAAAKWAVGLRTPSANEATVVEALAQGSIVRTWPMRGTLHLVAAQDVRWILRLLTPRAVARNQTNLRRLGLDEAVFRKSRSIITKALTGGQQLRRDQLYELLEKQKIVTTQQRGMNILWFLAQEGLICFGPHEGKQPCFVLLDEWVPDDKRKYVEGETALGVLAARYFKSHGPATLKDFAWWSGLSVTEAKIGYRLAAEECETVAVDGVSYLTPREWPVMDKKTLGAHLVPGFDEYLLGYADRSAVLAGGSLQRIVPGNNGVFLPMMVYQGVIMGTWKRTITKVGVSVELQPFAGCSGVQMRAFQKAARRYGDYLRLVVSCG